MIDSAAAILATFLIPGTFGDPTASAPTWPLYRNRFPDVGSVPDSAATITDVSDEVLARRLANGQTVRDWNVQLRVRALKDEDAFTKLEAARAVIEAITDQAVVVGANSYTVQTVSPVTTLNLGAEKGGKERHHFTLNLQATIV